MDNLNMLNEILNKTKEELEKMIPVNIMLIGKTGVGKSTLINNIFREKLTETGIGKPVTKHLRKISKEGVPINIYDTKGLELSEEVQHEVRKEIDTEVDRLNKSKNDRDLLHVVWYCINAQSNRIEDYEINWIRDLAERIPVIVVLTQSVFDNSVEMEKQIDSLNLDIRGIQRVIAEPFKVGDFIVEQRGLKELMEVTYQVLPEGVRRSFNNAQRVDIEHKAKEARKWALGYISTTFGVGFTPIPFSDAAILAPLQVGMIAHITTIFGVKIERALMTSIVSSVGGITGATFLGRTVVSNLLKLIPGAGTVVGGLISGSTASIITTGLAFSYIEVMKVVARDEYEGRMTNNEEIAKMMRNELEKQLRKK